jgi:hypothetical protein
MSFLPESIGPHTQSVAQITNLQSQQLSLEYLSKQRPSSTASNVSERRRAIPNWNPSSNPEDVFKHQIAHLTKSSIFLPEHEGDILYEKQRFRQLRSRQAYMTQFFELEKEIQTISSELTQMNGYIQELEKKLELQTKRREGVRFNLSI